MEFMLGLQSNHSLLFFLLLFSLFCILKLTNILLQVSRWLSLAFMLPAELFSYVLWRKAVKGQYH